MTTTADDLTTELARRIQKHVPVQPDLRRGDAPAPVQISYDATAPGNPWTVKFVQEVRGGRRIWGYAGGDTAEAALQMARNNQLRGT